MFCSTKTCALHWWLCALLLSVLNVSWSFGFPVSLNDVTVPIGREIYLDSNHIKFPNLNAREMCKVEVLNEPITQRVGSLDPKVFDCYFKKSTVKYTHFGSPLLLIDGAQFRACRFTENTTECIHFLLMFNIVNASYETAEVTSPLIVTEFFGLSTLVDENVLRLKVSRDKGATCIIRVLPYQSMRPARGQLVICSKKKPLEFIKQDCIDFLKMDLCYEHLKPPSPDIDYVAILIEASDPVINNGQLLSEWIHIPVLITPAFPNLPPKAAFSSMFLMDVDQFILTTITPLTLAATDNETPPERLIYNISKPLPPEQGSIVHLSDHTKPILSFKHTDLSSYDIAYKPPPFSFEERRMFEITFTAMDEDFAFSDPIVLHISVRPAVTSSPRVLVNVGLTLLEGQSRCILPENLEIVDKNNMNSVKIFVTGGLSHGQLHVNGKPAIVFGPVDIVSGNVVYVHDDSDSTKDSIHLRVTDSVHSVYVKFPISIIPKDDSPPSLITSVVISLNEGETFLITGDILRASDLDTPDELISFVIIKAPTSGVIWRKLAWEKTGIEVHRFSQKDILKGFIYYHHKKTSALTDEFEVILQDINNPPNRSPPYRISVRISSKRDHPPEPDPSCSFRLKVPETDAGIIKPNMLKFIDAESKPSEIIYMITSPPRYVGSFAIPGTGKIVSLANQTSTEKNISLPAISKFTQEEVTHLKIAYMPPEEEIGPHPRFLEFVFSVADVEGNIIHGQIFNITVLPVNNQPPQLHVGHLVVDEGSSVLLSTNEFSVYDLDTPPSDLQISVFTVPLHGTLRRSGQTLRVGDLLLLEDVLSLRLEYVHDGSETSVDSLVMGVNDGIHFVLGTIFIQIEPVDDEPPVWRKNLTRDINVEEGGTTVITSSVIAATDIDTDDASLHLILTEVPRLGSILAGGKVTTRFTQKDIMDGKIFYAHNSQEIGPYPIQDSFTLMLTDKAFPRLMSHIPHKVIVTIHPKNSQFPRISSRRALLVGEGQRIAISEEVLTAYDEDTLPIHLQFFVVKQPQFGYLEKFRRLASHERKSLDRHITSFTLYDIKRSHVGYIQAKHQGMEPESDSFHLYVSDGAHNSSSITILVNIVLRNDEVPEVSFQNLTLQEGSTVSLDETFMVVTDQDFPPSDVILVSLSHPPLFGMLKQQVKTQPRGESVQINFTQLSLEEFYHSVVYIHDGSENFDDRFGLEVSDGAHKVFVTIYVTVIPVNDEHPILVRKGGEQEVNMGSSLIITGAILLAVDKDSGPDELLYKILSPPAFGVLQKGSLNDSATSHTWVDLVAPLEFTQSDLNDNLIRYHPWSNSTFSTKDGFQYTVTDGAFFTNPEYFTLLLSEKPQLIPLMGTATVLAGGSIILNSSIISIQNADVAMEKVIFLVTRAPKHGNLENLSKPGVPIMHFKLLDIISGTVIYNHTDVSTLVGSDGFDFLVTSDSQESNGTLSITILPPQSSDDEFFVEMDEPFIVSDDGLSTITSRHLLAYDFDTLPEYIVYTVAKFPTWGILLKSGRQMIDYTFTQEDIGNKLITYYKDKRAKVMNDSFLFSVSNGKSSGFIYKGVLQKDPLSFTIFFPSPPNTSTIPIHQAPQPVDRLGRGLYGFVLSGSYLSNLIPNKLTLSNVKYNIVTGPKHGFLRNSTSGNKIRKSFNHHDLEQRYVQFIINTFSLSVHQDEVDLVIASEKHKKQGIIRLNFEWAVVEFAYPEYAVCEDSGPAHIQLSRKGSLNLSVYIEIEVVDHSTRKGDDFVPSKAKQIQFDPGETLRSWSFTPVDDKIEESHVEQFILLLKNPVNAVLGSQKLVLINIHDKRKGSCPRYFDKKAENLPTNVSNPQSKGTGTLLRPPCEENTYSLLHLNHSTGKVYYCDGHNWSLWKNLPDYGEELPKQSSVDVSIPGVAPFKHLQDASQEFQDILPIKGQDGGMVIEQKALGCPDGWHLYQSKCYHWFKQRLTWNDANNICETAFNAHLTSVLSSEHNTWLVQLARKKPFWIGLNAKGKHNNWTYTSLQQLSYRKWKKGFPRMSRNSTIKYKCVIVREMGMWMNKHCDHHRHSFICSKLRLVRADGNVS